jgi:hypothetical protein
VVEGHHSCHHKEEDHTQGKDVRGKTLVGLALMDLGRKITLGAHMRIEDTDKAALGYGLGKGEVTNSEVERGINQNVLEFDVPMNDALVEMEVRKSRN